MSAGCPSVVRKYENQDIILRKLTPYDRAELLRREKARQRASLLQSLRDVQAEKGESITTLRDFDSQMLGSSDFLNLFDSLAGKADVFDLVLSEMTMAGPGVPSWTYQDDINLHRAYIASLDMGESTILAAELCGVTLGGEPEEAEPDTYGNDPNPTKGEALIPPT